MKLLFSGDFAPLLDQKDLVDDPFQGVNHLLEDCDLHITNLECPFTRSDAPIEKTGPSLRADPRHIDLLRQARVDLACMANNHIFDYGERGILDTIEVCKQNNIETPGIVNRPDGMDHSLVKEVKGKRIAFVNLCEHEFSVRAPGLIGANGYDDIEAFYHIRSLRKEVSYLVVLYHGGNEYYPLPNPGLKKTFHYLADLGADAVIGHHTHVLGGYEIYRGKPLVYSLGNFFFPSDNEPEEWYTGMICMLEMGEVVKLNFFPILQCRGGYEIVLPDEPLRKEIMEKVEKLSFQISNDETLAEEWDRYTQGQGSGMTRFLLHSSRLERYLLRSSALCRLSEKYFRTSQRRLVISNVIRCQSLRHLILDSLNQKNREK